MKNGFLVIQSILVIKNRNVKEVICFRFYLEKDIKDFRIGFPLWKKKEDLFFILIKVIFMVKNVSLISDVKDSFD